MGLASAPGIMQMVTAEAARLVEQRWPGVKARVYLDDFLFTAETPEELLPVGPLLRYWGFNLNERKSIMTPTRRLTYLGIDVDLRHRQLTVATDTQNG